MFRVWRSCYWHYSISSSDPLSYYFTHYHLRVRTQLNWHRAANQCSTTRIERNTTGSHLTHPAEYPSNERGILFAQRFQLQLTANESFAIAFIHRSHRKCISIHCYAGSGKWQVAVDCVGEYALREIYAHGFMLQSADSWRVESGKRTSQERRCLSLFHMWASVTTGGWLTLFWFGRCLNINKGWWAVELDWVE